ncbi:hypothetical protein CI610_03132 [invertebrate metagenome]|uniref:Uncharacterized protein n=1 Tax=invertebrate metagenome TaxID=1711999 RepID=A0A2H9T403_9ZZZZ
MNTASSVFLDYPHPDCGGHDSGLKDDSLSTLPVEHRSDGSSFDIELLDNQLQVRMCTVQLAKEATSQTPSCWGFTYRELEDEQEKDTDLQFIRKYLLDGSEPGQGELFLTSPEAKYYWLNRNSV